MRLGFRANPGGKAARPLLLPEHSTCKEKGPAGLEPQEPTSPPGAQLGLGGLVGQEAGPTLKGKEVTTTDRRGTRRVAPLRRKRAPAGWVLTDQAHRLREGQRRERKGEEGFGGGVDRRREADSGAISCQPRVPCKKL